MPIGHVCVDGWGAGTKASCRRCSRRLMRADVYADPRWRRCRELVKARAGHRCVLCRRHESELDAGERLLADHYPEPVLDVVDPFDPEACRCVCSTCGGSEDGARAHAAGR